MVSEVEPSHAFLQAGTLKAAFGAGRICNGFVVARKGAVVRQDASLRSPLICTLTRSTKVLCVDEATVPSRHAVSRGGRVKRVRIVAPMQGWCSAKSLRFEDRIIHLTSSEDLIHRLGNKIKGAWHKIDAATKRRDETLLELLREKVVIVTDKEFVQNLGTHNESQSRSNFADVDGLRRACDRSQESAPQKMETDNSLSVLSLRAAIEQENKTCQTDTYGADGIDYKGRALPRRPEVAELDDSNFEKATRAVTGDAEDWLICFVAPWCTYSKRIAPVIQSLARDLTDYGTKVGRLDVTESPQIACRFGIRALPTIILLHAGSMFEFNGRRTTDALLEFVRSGFESLPGYAIPPDIGRQPNIQLSLPLVPIKGYFPCIPHGCCRPSPSMANRGQFYPKTTSYDADASTYSASVRQTPEIEGIC